MKNFIARMGYTFTFAIGMPEYSLEEKFEEYYIVGLALTIIAIVATICLIISFIWYCIIKRLNKEIEVNNNEKI